mmetsp:Transcript_8936/g.26617  ORF Transcript_8936/g.26617 Transcript_8936/m.26617 type:complete len:262 (-) Transcript_8936:267-1052(-)
MDFPQNGVLQVIDPPLVLEFNVQAVLDPDLHLDGLVLCGCKAQDLDPNVVFFLERRQKFSIQYYLDKVSYRNIASSIRLVLLVHVAKQEGKFGDGLIQYTRWGQLFGKRHKVVMGPPLVDAHAHIDASNELNLDPQMFYLFPGCNLECHNPTNVLALFVGKKGCFLHLVLPSRHKGYHGCLASETTAIWMFYTPKRVFVQFPVGIMVYWSDGLWILLLFRRGSCSYMNFDATGATNGVEESTHIHSYFLLISSTDYSIVRE